MDYLLPSIGELIGLIYSWGQPLFNAMAPFMWYIIGIPVAFIILKGVANIIMDAFNDLLERRQEIQNERIISMQEWKERDENYNQFHT